ncbi:MAG TPA: hypothetical protein VGH89_13435, partial [Pseudonocardia sp.]
TASGATAGGGGVPRAIPESSALTTSSRSWLGPTDVPAAALLDTPQWPTPDTGTDPATGTGTDPADERRNSAAETDSPTRGIEPPARGAEPPAHHPEPPARRAEPLLPAARRTDQTPAGPTKRPQPSVPTAADPEPVGLLAVSSVPAPPLPAEQPEPAAGHVPPEPVGPRPAGHVPPEPVGPRPAARLLAPVPLATGRPLTAPEPKAEPQRRVLPKPVAIPAPRAMPTPTPTSVPLPTPVPTLERRAARAAAPRPIRARVVDRSGSPSWPDDEPFDAPRPTGDQDVGEPT